MNLDELAKEAAGNWRKFGSFAWHDKPEDPQDWCIVYTHNRDSRLLEESNADMIAKELEPFMEGDDPDVIAEHHGHWACGWVDGYAIRVYRYTHIPGDGFADGGCAYTMEECREITPAFKRWCELQEALSDYPVLDEEDYSRREYDATLENISSEGGCLVPANGPEDWVSQVFSWLWDNNQRAVENRDDQGGYPSREEIKEALLDLGLIPEDDDE